MLHFHVQSRDRLAKNDDTFNQTEHETESYSATLVLALLRLQYFTHDTRLSVWNETNKKHHNWNPETNQHPDSITVGDEQAALVETFDSSVINPAALDVHTSTQQVVPHFSVDQLADIVYAEGDDSQIMHAVLCQVYHLHLTLHNQFRKGL